MKIAIASGKGGTGKTTVAVSMALALAEREKVTLLDCDVEEPNSHIFLHVDQTESENVMVKSPVVDKDKCTACGECGLVCQFNAIAALKTKPLIFPELCHSCGACVMACPEGAISEVDREVGIITKSTSGNLNFITGCVNIGEAMSIPVIKKVKKSTDRHGTTILDCPPGTACPMVAAVNDADFAVLVTEPTPFGLHDLTLAVDTLRHMGIPFGVVLNRADGLDLSANNYCEEQGIAILMEIPDDRMVAEAYSRGEPLIKALPDLAVKMTAMVDRITKGAAA